MMMMLMLLPASSPGVLDLFSVAIVAMVGIRTRQARKERLDRNASSLTVCTGTLHFCRVPCIDIFTHTDISHRSRQQSIMPLVHITWLPKACRTAATRKEVADAVIKV